MYKRKGYNMLYVFSLAVISAMGGLLFGYDWVVIGGAKPFYEIYFDIDAVPSLQGWAMSSALTGCIAGAVVSGVLSDKYGRKPLLILAAILFTVSAYGTGYTDNFNYFIIYRIVGGIGIGLASTLSPIYIAEVSPAEFRGRFVSINQLTIVIGILAAQITNLMIARPVEDTQVHTALLDSWNVQHGWRWMFWAELVPSLLFLGLMFLVPESPRFLARLDKDRKAEVILGRIGGLEYARTELEHIRRVLRSDSRGKVRYGELMSSGVAPILIIGIVLAVFQQWCGINIIFNYAQEVFSAAGYDINDMFMNIVITGSVNLIFTFVAMRTVDHWGRRTLMLVGSGGLAVIYILIGSMYYMEFTGWPVLLLVIAGIAVYAMSLAPVTWVVLSEIFPNRVRGVAMSLATLSLWVASFVLTYTFPLLNSKLGAHGTFWVYSVICIAGFLYIRRRLPETKNKSLEDIEQQFTQNEKENEDS
ncbi:MFS transporter [Sinomicrobium soli]|nr:MFS transporter [Sinomicrobium sp. N-1-3-6]